MRRMERRVSTSEPSAGLPPARLRPGRSAFIHSRSGNGGMPRSKGPIRPVLEVQGQDGSPGKVSDLVSRVRREAEDFRSFAKRQAGAVGEEGCN